jgi:hypothetical protein
MITVASGTRTGYEVEDRVVIIMHVSEVLIFRSPLGAEKRMLQAAKQSLSWFTAFS